MATEPETPETDSPWVVTQIVIDYYDRAGVVEYHASNTVTGEYERSTDKSYIDNLVKKD